MGKTLILIDGHALAFRQYYALERTNMQTSENVQTWAVYGFFKAIFDLLENKNINPDSLVVTFDVSRHTFRTDMYEDYKGQREAMPDSLHLQLGYICEGLKAFNIPIYTKEGFEADDLIGTISKMASEKGDKTYILTGDQDSFQLIDKEGLTQVLIPYGGKLIQYDWDKVFEKWGVYPNQVIDYKALRGDVSDNIPGVKGIGEKTAQKLLGQYQTLENILADCENLTPPSVKTKICEGKDMALLSQKLATIIRDVDIDFDFESAKVVLPNMEDALAFLKKYQLNSFIRNIDKIMRAFNKNEVNVSNQTPAKPQAQSSAQQSLFDVPQQAQNSDGTVQLGLFADVAKEIVNNKDLSYEKEFLKEDVSGLISKIKEEKCFALDIVANFKNAVNSDIIALAFGLKDKVYYLLYSEKILLDLKEILEDENIKKITYDGKDDINILKCKGIDLKGIECDVTLASYINNPANKHDLDVQALNFLGYIMENIPDSVRVKKDVYDYKRAMDDELFKYSSDRAFVTFELSKYWKENLDEKELKLLSDFEVPLLYVLADMEFEGVSLDKDYLKELSEEMDAEIKDYEEKVYQIAGETFNINSPKQVSEILFDKLEIKGKGKKQKKSTGAEVLEELAEENEICRYILEVRKYAKLKNTYTDSLPLLIDKDERVHTTYNQTVTTTGRLSSSNPNLQNIPTRTKEGNKLRACIIPRDKENNLILSADYSQIELRLLAHVSKDENLIEAFRTNHDVHTITASKVFGVPVEEVTKEMRYKSKAVNFGIIYGQTKYGLAKALGISANEAQDFIDKYFMTYPRVHNYMENTVAFALSHGYVETIFGRKRYVQNELSSPNHMIREFAKRAAINQPLQGTAADLIKLAMIETYKELNNHKLKSKMIMQVHDELVIEVQKEEQEEVKEIVVKAMELNQPLAIPLKVDVNLSRTWQEQ